MMRDIYDPQFVKNLFDEMSTTYEIVNYLSSFGFSHRWRTQFIDAAMIQPGMIVCDLMCGMGECWGAVTKHLNYDDILVAQDFSRGMLAGAQRRFTGFHEQRIYLIQENVLTNSLKNESVDCVICGFGIKTLSFNQLQSLVREVGRILKPGGSFSFIELSVPKGWVFVGLFMRYLNQVVPIIGKLLLGNPDNYRMLGEYVSRFQNCRDFYNLLLDNGIKCSYDEYFFGCATGVSGTKF